MVKNSDFWTYALTSASYNAETLEDRMIHAARGLASIEYCLSIHATYCVIVAGASPGEAKMRAAVPYVKTGDFLHCGSNNWETVEDRWVHAAGNL